MICSDLIVALDRIRNGPLCVYVWPRLLYLMPGKGAAVACVDKGLWWWPNSGPIEWKAARLPLISCLPCTSLVCATCLAQEELEEYQLRKRADFESDIRKNPDNLNHYVRSAAPLL